MCSLGGTHCKRNLVPARKQVAHKLKATKSSFSGSKRVQRPLPRQDNSCSNRQHHSGCLHKQGRRHEVRPTVWPAVENLDLVSQETGDSEGPTHSRPAECGCGQAIQTRPDIHTEWSLLPEVFQLMYNRWHQPLIHLFAVRFDNNWLNSVPDALAWAVNTLSLSWEDLDPYAFPPVAIFGKVVVKLRDYPCWRIILIAWGGLTCPGI